jgi:hypothetical protein
MKTWLLSRLRQLFSLNTLILTGALGFFWCSISCGIQSLEDIGGFSARAGVLSWKKLEVVREDKTTYTFLRLRLYGSDTLYTISNHPARVDNLVQAGDSVYIYTRTPSGFLLNFTSDGNSHVWGSKDPNEILHLTTPVYDVLVDYGEQRSALRFGFAAFLFAGACFLFWFWYRRSGARSPFVQEYCEISL